MPDRRTIIAATYHDAGWPEMDVSLELLLLKVAIAPVFIAVISLIAGRYGNRAAGWLVALPINTGAILVILTLTEGSAFAAKAAAGALLGIVSLCAFAFGYARSALRYRWPVCLGIATAGFVVSTLLLSKVPELVPVDLAGVALALALVVAILPKRDEAATAPPVPRWEIPMRMLTAALLVLTITTVSREPGSSAQRPPQPDPGLHDHARDLHALAPGAGTDLRLPEGSPIRPLQLRRVLRERRGTFSYPMASRSR